jgi:hypothetical protein
VAPSDWVRIPALTPKRKGEAMRHNATEREIRQYAMENGLHIHEWHYSATKKYPHETHYFSIENRESPWWEFLWQRLMWNQPFHWFGYAIRIPCIGCKILGDHHEGIGNTLEAAFSTYLCDIGECEGCTDFDDCHKEDKST